MLVHGRRIAPVATPPALAGRSPNREQRFDRERATDSLAAAGVKRPENARVEAGGGRATIRRDGGGVEDAIVGVAETEAAGDLGRLLHRATAFVDGPVVRATDEHQVLERCLASVLPVDDVVGVEAAS